MVGIAINNLKINVSYGGVGKIISNPLFYSSISLTERAFSYKYIFIFDNIFYMKKQFFKDTIGWGLLLWLIGYILGIVLFMIVPPSILGWVIMPIGTIITLWVLFKKIKNNTLKYYLLLSVFWTLIAIIFDYFFLVKLFKPADGYYKLDIYVYYTLTFVLPLVVGFKKNKSNLN